MALSTNHPSEAGRFGSGLCDRVVLVTVIGATVVREGATRLGPG
jgi:hypothetical protein